jgi:hypothetical protein
LRLVFGDEHSADIERHAEDADERDYRKSHGDEYKATRPAMHPMGDLNGCSSHNLPPCNAPLSILLDKPDFGTKRNT